MNKKIIITVLAIMTFACKEKKVAQTEAFVPNRSDYIMASSKAFITACDSGAKITSRAIQNEQLFPIKYDATAEKLFEVYRSLNKKELVLAFDDQVRDILTEVVADIHIPSSLLMKISEKDYPEDFLKRNIMVQKYLEPNLDSLQSYIARQSQKKYFGTRASSLWIDMNTMYNMYNNAKLEANFSFDKVARSAALSYIKNTKIQEDTAKKYYQLWENKRAVETMDYLRKN